MQTSGFHPRASVSLVCAARWPLDQSLDFLIGLGVSAVSVTGSQLHPNFDLSVARIMESGVAVASVGTGGHQLLDSADLTLERLKPFIDAAQHLNSPYAFTVSGPTLLGQSTDEAYSRLIACLPAATDYAKVCGVRLAVEISSVANRQLGFVHSLADACWLANEADIDVVVELQNCWHERGLRRIFDQHHKRFAIVNVSDFNVGDDLRFNRRVPGDGSMPLEWLIGNLLEAGYAGRFDLEFLGPAIEAEGYADAISRGVDWLCERLNRWSV